MSETPEIIIPAITKPPTEADNYDRLDTISIKIHKNLNTGTRDASLIAIPFSSATDAYDKDRPVEVYVPILNELITSNPSVAQAFGAFIVALNDLFNGRLNYPVEFTANPDATVTVVKNSVEVFAGVTNSEGKISTALEEGDYEVTYSLTDYVTQTVAVTITRNQWNYSSATLQKIPDPVLTITGPVSAAININGDEYQLQDFGDGAGRIIVPLPKGQYTITSVLGGYTDTPVTVDLQSDMTVACGLVQSQ